MKLTEDVLEIIILAVNTAKLIDIEEVIIDKSGIRALHPDRIAVLLFKYDLSDFLPFESIGINRLSTFIQRISIIKDIQNINVDCEVDNNNNAKSLKFYNEKLSISYKCANISTIKAPKNVMEVFNTEVHFTEESFNILSKAFNIMKSETFTLINDKNGIRFELTDSNNDIFSYNFSNIVKNDNNSVFAHKYPIKIFLPILKQNPDSLLQIGEKGVLKVNVKNIDIMILPKK